MPTEKKWDYNKEEGFVTDLENHQVIFHVEDINPKVIEGAVDVFNKFGDVELVKQKLDMEDGVTPDEIEYVMERIVDHMGQYYPIKEEPSQKEETAQKEEPLQESGEQTAQEKEEKKARARKTRETPMEKKPSIDEEIKSLEDKISLMKLLREVKTPELPAGLNKTARETMSSFYNDYDALVKKYIDRVRAI